MNIKYKMYKRSIRQVHINKAVVFFLIVIITMILIYYKSIPVIETVCKYTSTSIARQISIESTEEVIKDVTYKNLVELTQNSNGEILAITANTIELNKLSGKITENISNKLNNIEDRFVKVPISSIFRMGLISGYGPDIKLAIVPTGSVISKFKSKFEAAGINQTKHTISVEIITKVRLIAPFYTSSEQYVNEITVAETIIVGNVPDTYYNITGVEDLSKKETFEFME